MASIITYLKDIDINFSSLKTFVGIKLEDFVYIIRLILDNSQKSTINWEGYDLNNNDIRGLDIEKPTTALAMNNPGENNQQSGSDDNPGGKKKLLLLLIILQSKGLLLIQRLFLLILRKRLKI